MTTLRRGARRIFRGLHARMLLAHLLVIAGGLALRFLIVQAGQVSHWARVPGL